MAKFIFDFNYIDLERKNIIIERAKEIKYIVDKYIEYKYRPIKQTISYYIEKSYAEYCRYFNDTLSDEEYTFFSLYIIFPSDDLFLKLLNNENKNLKKVAEMYNVNEKIVYERYLSLLKMEREKFILKNKKTINGK